jgi:hypothetical protein
MTRMKWKPEWIVEAKRLGREMWEDHYRVVENSGSDVVAREVSISI